jgi:hypothetical protein
MNGTSVCLAALVTALVGVGTAWGQYPTLPAATDSAPATTPGMTGPGPTTPGDMARPDGTAPAPEGYPADLGGPPVVGPGLSKWILGTCPGCCGPVGGNGPVQMETYVRAGVSFPLPADRFSRTLSTGWEIAGGGRSLFFDPEQDAAWVIDLGISNIHYPGQHPDLQFKLLHIFVPTTANPFTGQTGTAIINFVPKGKLKTVKGKNNGPNTVTEPFGVTVANLNQTFVSVGGGREWYLWGTANCGEPTWRVGLDVGGRYGTEKLNLHQLRHRTDTIAGLYVAAHSDIEYPCGCCTFFGGVRVEWDYIWGDILQEQNVADTETINLLLTAGVRF